MAKNLFLCDAIVNAEVRKMKKNTEEKKPQTTEKKENKEQKAEENSVKAEKMAGSTGETDTSAPEEQPETEAKKEEQKNSPEEQLAALQDKYLRLSAEFDNYRKRNLREKMELTKTAGEGVLISFLPILDDFERALQSIQKSQDIEATKKGIELIYNKLKDFLTQKGIKEIDAMHQPFTTDFHEAITNIPVEDEAMKGKVVDVLQKGYTLHEKVVRYSKVVVGA